MDPNIAAEENLLLMWHTIDCTRRDDFPPPFTLEWTLTPFVLLNEVSLTAVETNRQMSTLCQATQLDEPIRCSNKTNRE